jgi:tetratricopeptide (TPR) repeat protein
MNELELQSSISEIRQACENRPGKQSPFFFILGAGISAPTIPLASEIESECKAIAALHGRTVEPKIKTQIESYSHWFGLAFPNAEQRQQYLRKKIQGKLISPAVFRLAHLLMNRCTGNLVVTPNFDDFLSRALTLFGEQHIVCDHPSTIGRISIESDDIQIIHVHGTYWFYDCCNLKAEIAQRAISSPSGPVTVPSFLEHLLWNRSPIVMGYSGWEGDVIMTALQRRLLSSMPFNVYWFCYRRSDCELLPSWLREHPNVRFIVPKVEMVANTVQTVVEPLEGGFSDPQSVKGGAVVPHTLPAKKILDLLVSSFKVDAPPLTRDPLQFFADQLNKTVFREDDQQSESDIYGLKSVVARVYVAIEMLARSDHAKSAIDLALEGVRNALRRSDYMSAIEIARNIERAHATDQQLEDLINTTASAAEGLDDNSTAELEGYELVCVCAQKLARQRTLSYQSTLIWARTLMNKGITLGNLDRNNEEIDVYNEIVQRFGDASEAALRERAGQALINKGITLDLVGRSADEIAAYDDLIRLFGDAAEPALREHVAQALMNKAITLNQLSASDDEVAVYDEIVQRFDAATEPVLRESVAKALVNKGLALSQGDRSDDAFAACNEVLRRFGDAIDPTLREQVAKALINKGATLGRLNRITDAIAAYDEALQHIGSEVEPALRETLATAMASRGFYLTKLDRGDEAIAAFDELLRRFGDAEEPALRERLAWALGNKGAVLSKIDRNDDAIVVYSELVQRFGEATEVVLRQQVARALIDKSWNLMKLNRNDEAIATCDEIVQRFCDMTDTALQKRVAEALDHAASILTQLKRTAEARSRYTKLIDRFHNHQDPEIVQYVAEARKFIAAG